MNIKKIIREEMDGLQWIKDVKVNPWDGIEFKVSAHKTLKTTYKILDWGDPEGVRVVWRDNDDYRNEWKYNHYTREEVEKYFNKGKWVMVEKSGHHYDFNENITEGEDDLEWIKGNPIDVGKCFIINDYYRSLNAVVTIKEMEQREWKNNIYQKGGEFNPDDIIIHLVGVTQEDKEDVGPNFRITYNELVENINDGNLVPTDCGNNINESDELDWIRNTALNPWDYFEELIKDEPEINIEKNEDGEWVDFKDNEKRPYFGRDLFVDYELEEDIKSNPLPDFLNAVSQHIEVTFQGYDYEEDEDYWDFLTLKEVLEKANKATQ